MPSIGAVRTSFD